MGKKFFSVIGICIMLVISTADSVGANCDSASYVINNAAGKPTLHSHAWFENSCKVGPHKYKVRSFITGKGTPEWIKASWTVNTTGISVSVSGIGASSGNSSASASFTNNKNTEACWQGQFKISGPTLTISLTNTASVLIGGVGASVAASTWCI